MILDLRFLNCSIRRRKFRIETICSVKSLLKPGDLMAAFYIKEAYLHILIYELHKEFLRIAIC